MALTKQVKALAEYQQWLTADLATGYILDLRTSLGHDANIITVESTGGDTVIRLNVSHEIHKNQESAGNKILFGPDAAFFKSPVLVDEVEIETPNIIIESGSAWILEGAFPVKDIKIIQLAPAVKITVF